MTEDTGGSLGTSQALRNGEEFRLLVDSVVDYAIFLLDPEGIVLTWNPGAERLKGYHADDIIGRHFSTFYPEPARRDGLPGRLLAEARENGRTEHSGWRVRKDGSTFWADVVITALYHEDGSLHGFGKVTRDMTELHLAQQDRDEALHREREAVQRLQQLDGWRRDFIRSIAHDLQTPVVSLTGFADLLDDDLPAETRRGFLDRIRANAHSLQTMIDHLRTYVLVESDRVTLSVETVMLDAFVRDLVSNMEPILARHEVDVDVSAEVAARADPQALERILRNLLGNAARHTPATGTLTIAARTDGDTVTVEVRDTGEGIAAEVLPKVFDKFERGPHGRTGLGLAIVKEYVELHGGTLDIRSQVGQGTTVSFQLPAAPPGPAPGCAGGTQRPR